jgi:hypothetical protein
MMPCGETIPCLERTGAPPSVTMSLDSRIAARVEEQALPG